MILDLEQARQTNPQVTKPLGRDFSWPNHNKLEAKTAPEQIIPQTPAEEFGYWLGGNWITPIALDSFFKFQLKSRESTEAESKNFIYLTQYLVEELVDVLVSFEATSVNHKADLHLNTPAGKAYVFLGGNTGREMFGERKHDVHEWVSSALRGKKSPLSPKLTERLKNYQPNCDIRMLVPADDQAKLAEVIQAKFASELSDLKLVSLRPGFSMVVGYYSSFFNFRTQTYVKTPVYFIMLDPNISLEDDWRIGPEYSDDQRRFFPYGLDQKNQKTAFQSHRLMHSERILSLQPAKIDHPKYKSPLRILNATTRMILPRAYQFRDDDKLFKVFNNQTVAALRRELSRLLIENVWEDDSWHEPEIEAQLAVCAYYAPKLTLKLLLAIGWLSGPAGSALDTRLPDYDWQNNPTAEVVIAEFLKVKGQAHKPAAAQNWQIIKTLLQNFQISPVIQKEPDKFLL